MLFHDPVFVFGFLPAVVIGYGLVRRFLGREPGFVFLGLASLSFYGSHDVRLAALLVGSITMNFTCGEALGRLPHGRAAARALLGLGILANLALLGYFKYSNFFIGNLRELGFGYDYVDLIFPVGLSFYSFVQIGYLVDVYAGLARRQPFARYFLFGAFFPYVTAGPLVLQREILPQYDARGSAFPNAVVLAAGVSIFVMGLFKKLVLADNVAPFANGVFAVAADGGALAPGAAWTGALAYTLQLYFDFSAYSDMAIGLGALLGFKLPPNFNSPLKACSLIEFWRRWHITMSRFFTNYVYMPLAVGGSRRFMDASPWTRFGATIGGPVFVTFLVAGIWHGAGWTFVVFGLLHGAGLVANHAWAHSGMSSPPRTLGWLLTLLLVVVSLVFFRAESISSALAVLQGMTGLTSSVADAQLPVVADPIRAWTWIVALAGLALVAPNTLQIMRRCDLLTERVASEPASWWARLVWQPNVLWALACGITLVVSILSVSGESPFLYYRF